MLCYGRLDIRLGRLDLRRTRAPTIEAVALSETGTESMAGSAGGNPNRDGAGRSYCITGWPRVWI